MSACGSGPALPTSASRIPAMSEGEVCGAGRVPSTTQRRHGDVPHTHSHSHPRVQARVVSIIRRQQRRIQDNHPGKIIVTAVAQRAGTQLGQRIYSTCPLPRSPYFPLPNPTERAPPQPSADTTGRASMQAHLSSMEIIWSGSEPVGVPACMRGAA